MPFQIIRNDITKVSADAVVNTANPHPVCGSGTDEAVYRAAGMEELLAERQKIGEIAPGQTAVTPAFALPAKYIFHTVGPSWVDGEHGEFDTLASCYDTSLGKAAELGCESIAFPLIATGNYGFPKDRALQIAISRISAFLMDHEMLVILVVYDSRSFELSGKVFREVNAFIDDSYVEREASAARKISNRLRRRDTMLSGEMGTALYSPQAKKAGRDSGKPPMIEEAVHSSPAFSTASLDDVIAGGSDTFQEKLLKLIDERELTDVEVYKKANLDRKLFSKIRCNADYHPKKRTALALAIALELSLAETKDLLERAEIALSPSSTSDRIITWFISNRRYDIFEINLALFEHSQPILGA